MSLVFSVILFFYVHLMIVCLSLPSSLSCTQASTLICNYLYFIYTVWCTKHASSMMMFSNFLFLDCSRRVFFFQLRNEKFPTLEEEPEFLWISFSRASNFVNEIFPSSFHSPFVTRCQKPHGNVFPLKFFHVFHNFVREFNTHL